jgi:hypothetical protein
MQRFWVLMVLVLATACTPTEPLEPIAHNTPHDLLLAPDSLGRSLSLSQLVTGEYGVQTYQLRYELEITPSRLAIVGLSPLGITLFTLIHENNELTVETYADDSAPFDPRFTLFDLYLTHWPLEKLRSALAAYSMEIVERNGGSVRYIFDSQGNSIARITYPPATEGGETVIQHFDFPYLLRIVTLEAGL